MAQTPRPDERSLEERDFEEPAREGVTPRAIVVSSGGPFSFGSPQVGPGHGTRALANNGWSGAAGGW